MVSFCNSVWFVPLFIFLLRVVFQYRIVKLKKFREKFSQLRESTKNRPIIIAANHLTLIDSMFITWAVMSPQDYFLRFKQFPWNVPELSNFGRNILLRLMCYLGKCVYIERQGKIASKKLSLKKLSYLLRQGHSVCIFPEGGRSRLGKIDREGATYGIGQLVEEQENAAVFCIYLRSDSQKKFSNFPTWGDRFFIDVSAITPHSHLEGRRKHRDITLQIVNELERMEECYFNDWQRHHRSEPKYPTSSIC